jgi:Zn-dependent protease
MGAAIVAAGIGYATDSAFWFSLAHAGALLNLFNLVPLGTLDGGRAFRALDRRQRWLLCAILGGLMLMGGEPLLILLLLAAGFRALSKDAPTEPDRGAFMLFVAILAILCLLARIPAPAARPA